MGRRTLSCRRAAGARPHRPADRRELHGPSITSVSLDGLLVGATSGDITQYDLQTLKPVATFAGARGDVNTLQFSRDGRIPLATCNNQTVSVYCVTTRIRLGDPIPSAAPFIYPGFLRPDGDAVAVTVREGVAVWDLDPTSLAEAACTLAGRNLSRTEWDTYLRGLGELSGNLLDGPDPPAPIGASRR